MTTKSTSRHQRPITIFPAVSTHAPPPRARHHGPQSVLMKPSPPSRTHTPAPAAHLTTSLPLLSPTKKYLESSIRAKAKHGKERANYAELSTTEVEQYAQAPIASGSNMTPNIDTRPGKRRRLSVSRHQDVWQSEEDARLLNKAFRNAEDSLVVKDAQIAALQQELLHAQTSYHRKESELRQDLLFQHIMAQQRATRDHEKEKIGLHRLVAFLKVDHQTQTETLKEQHRSEWESERTRHQQALAQALKEKQHAVDRSHSAYLQVQNMHTVMEHANAVAKTFESDLDDLRRLDIEEAEQREKDRRGLPPSYDSISDLDKYISPYGANRNRDNGTLELDNIETTITSNFMRDLRAANRTSLALREHEERSRAAGAGSMLFHSGMLAFATACQQLRSLLENAIESHLEPKNPCGIVDNNEGPPRQSSRSAEFDVNSSVLKLPTLAELGIPVHSAPTPASSDTRTVEHPIDLFRRAPSVPVSSINKKAASPGVDTIIAVTDRISNTIFDLCTHVFAALDVREYCSEKLCNNKCIRLGQWLRLADDTLLQCLKRKLEATAVEDVCSQQVDQSLMCTKCKSDHCGGYCVRLHMLSHNITRLKSIRRTLDKVSSSARAGIYFNDTMNWLRDNLEKERELSAKAALPPGRQETPVMTDEEMALAMQYSVLDATQAAAQRAIQREDPPEELARRLQAVRDLHFPGPRYRIVSAMDGTSSIPSSPAGENDPGHRQPSTGQSSDRIETFVNRAHRHAEPPGVSSAGTRTSSSLAGDRSALLFHDGSPRPSASGVQIRSQRRMASEQAAFWRLADDDV